MYVPHCDSSPDRLGKNYIHIYILAYASLFVKTYHAWLKHIVGKVKSEMQLIEMLLKLDNVVYGSTLFIHLFRVFIISFLAIC